MVAQLSYSNSNKQIWLADDRTLTYSNKIPTVNNIPIPIVILFLINATPKVVDALIPSRNCNIHFSNIIPFYLITCTNV